MHCRCVCACCTHTPIDTDTQTCTRYAVIISFTSVRFSADYFRDPRRGYGQSISTVFMKLRFNVDDVYRPAMEQFDGKGSFGNGSAMRVTPAALFAYKNKDMLIEVTDSLTAYV